MMWYILAVIPFVTWPMAEATHWQESAKWRQISSKTPTKLQQENVQSLIRRLVGSEKADIFEVVVGEVKDKIIGQFIIKQFIIKHDTKYFFTYRFFYCSN